MIMAGGSCNRTIVIDDGVFGHFGQLLHADRPLPNPRLLDSRSEDGLPPLYCDILGNLVTLVTFGHIGNIW